MTMFKPIPPPVSHRIAIVGRRTEINHETVAELAKYYIRLGAIISGNAIGTDQASMRGASAAITEGVAEAKQHGGYVYLPWSSYEREAVPSNVRVHYLATLEDEEATLLAQAAHPEWNRSPLAVRLLMIRNARMALHATFAVAFPNPDKIGWGGTGHFIRCARFRGTPVWLPELNRYSEPADAVGYR